MENSTNIKFGIFSQFILILLILFYLATFINKNFNLIYSNIPLFSLMRFELYRIIPAIFISDNIYDLILNCLVVITIINFYEFREGTIKSFIKFFITAFVFQIFILILYFFFYYLFPIVLSFSIKPMPSIGIAFVTRHMLSTEEKEVVTYPNFKTNNRFLLLGILIGGLFINLGQFKFDFLNALYYGFLMCRFKKYLQYSPSEEDILHFEKNENYKFFFNLDSWISVEECFYKSNANFSPHDLNELHDIDTEIGNKKEKGSLAKNTNDSSVEHLDMSDNADNTDNTVANLISEQKTKEEHGDYAFDLGLNYY